MELNKNNILEVLEEGMNPNYGSPLKDLIFEKDEKILRSVEENVLNSVLVLFPLAKDHIKIEAIYNKSSIKITFLAITKEGKDIIYKIIKG